MKRIFSILAVAATLFAVSCSNKYDDTAVWDELGKHNERITKLETLCGQMNTNISSLQAIVTALQSNDYVTSVAPITQNGVEIGYTISFSKSGAITIYHGKDGADGKDGATPVVGVKQNTDGVYYWTVNGEWLLDDAGNKIKAISTDGKDGEDGKDGIAPQLKIENDYWYISYDSGATWTQLGKATGEDGQDGTNGTDGAAGKDGDSFFQSVTQDENNVIFTLADGTVLIVPKSSSYLFNKLQSVSYIPRYEDGKATVFYSTAENSQVEMDFEVSPKDAAAEIAAQWETILSLKAVNTQTRAVTYIDMPISGCTADAEKGIITVIASGSNLSEDFFAGTQPASARLGISDGNTNITSDFIPLVAVKQPDNEIWYTSRDGNIVEPYDSTVFGANIVSNTYENGRGVITFDGAVTEIGYLAFWGSGLTNITVPNGVTVIGDLAFYDCRSLTSITISDSVTEVGENPFTDCYNLAEFKGKFASEDGRCLIADGVLNSFAPAGITSYNIPNGVTEIGIYAFWGCSGLTDVTIPNGVTKIGDLAFYYCKSLTSIILPDSVTLIGYEAFDNCDGLTSITIPDSVTEIGDWVFGSCAGLTSITIPDSVTKIGQNPFILCLGLAEFKGKFASEDGRCLIVDGVLNSFAPDGLTEYTILDSVTKIGDDAFWRCDGLTSVVIPNNVTEIGNSAFYHCDGLTSVFCERTTPPTANFEEGSAWRAFVYNAAGRKIYVPRESVDAYKTADGWSEYADAVEGYDFAADSK